MNLMMLTAIASLFLPALVGPQFLSYFKWIYLFSFLTLYSIPTAFITIRKGQVSRNKIKMIMLYLRAIMITGGCILVPSRYLYGVFFG